MLLLSLQSTTARSLLDHEALSSTRDPSIVTEFPHAVNELILHELDEALSKLSNVYMQALFSGTHTAELAAQLDAMELRFYDLLDTLYREHRMSEYINYKDEVKRQMIVYTLLKKLFGYANVDEST